MNHAYSIFSMKDVNDGDRVITGMATTPQPDRMEDVVVPEGAQFKLPIPLLWQHDSRSPVGEVIKAKVTKAGIEIVARLAKIDEPGVLKDRLDEAWQSIKIGLVRGLSIGFRPIKHEEIDGSWGYRFTEWEWLELSPVTIPANAGASIENIKSLHQKSLSAAHGKQGQGLIMRLDDPLPALRGPSQ